LEIFPWGFLNGFGALRLIKNFPISGDKKVPLGKFQKPLLRAFWGR